MTFAEMLKFWLAGAVSGAGIVLAVLLIAAPYIAWKVWRDEKKRGSR